MINYKCTYKNNYIEKYGDIPGDYNVHHIDINRKNNDFNNLVAIPIKLHKMYHLNEKYMIWCFNKGDKTGFEYHRDVLIFLYHEIMSYKK